jgi:hypothetical protein
VGVALTDLGGTVVWASDAAPSTIYSDNLFATLSDGNIVVQTGGGGSGTGKITVSGVTFNQAPSAVPFSFTLNAAGDIVFRNVELQLAGDLNVLSGTKVTVETGSLVGSLQKTTIAADVMSVQAGASVSGTTGVELRGTTGNIKSINIQGGSFTAGGTAGGVSTGGPVVIYVTDPNGSPTTNLGLFAPTLTLIGTYPGVVTPGSGNVLVVAPPTPTTTPTPTPAPTPLPPTVTATQAAITETPTLPPVIKTLDKDPPGSFAAIDIANTPPAQVSEQLAARDLHMERVLASAMTRLNDDPQLASLPDCTTPQQAAQGSCLVTEAMLEPLRIYLDGAVQRLLRGNDQLALASVAGTPDCTGLDDALKGGCLVTDKLKLELRAMLAARNGSASDGARAGNSSNARSPIPQIKRKWAIVIGINDYVPAIPRLVNAQVDAHNLRDILQRRFGYDVTLVLNGRKAEIIAAFNRIAAQAQADDSLLVYYAGHGAVAKKSNEGYWVPSDARADDPASFISNSDILSLLNRMAPRQLALISDSCFSGSLIASDADRFRGRSSVSDPLEVLDKRAAVVMTAGRNEPVADADKDGKSVFAASLIKALEGVNGWFAGDRVFQDVARQIARSLEGQRALYAGLSKARHQPGADYLFEMRSLDAAR